MDQSTQVAVAGIGGTLVAGLAGPIVTQWRASKAARQSRFFEERLALYVEVMSYVEAAEDRLRWSLTAEQERGSPRPWKAPHSVDLTPRIELLADRAVRNAWTMLLTISERLEASVQAGNYSSGFSGIVLHQDNFTLAQQYALTELRVQLRTNIGAD